MSIDDGRNIEGFGANEGGVATLEAPEEQVLEPEVSLDESVRPEPESQMLAESRPEEDTQITLTPIEGDTLDLGIDPMTPTEDLFTDVPLTNLGGTSKEVVAEASKGKVLAFATQNPELEPTSLDAGRILQEELHLSMIAAARDSFGKRTFSKTSPTMQAAIEEAAIDALFEKNDIAFPGVEDRLQRGRAARFSALDEDLALVVGLAVSTTRDHFGERDRHQFPSLGNTSHADLTIPADREVQRMIPIVDEQRQSNPLWNSSAGENYRAQVQQAKRAA